jgi:hypothetical protein
MPQQSRDAANRRRIAPGRTGKIGRATARRLTKTRNGLGM